MARVNSVHDLASIARGRRLTLGLTQAELAKRMNVSRDWVNSFEAGKLRAELIFVLRLLEALGLQFDVTEQRPRRPGDLDDLLDRYRPS